MKIKRQMYGKLILIGLVVLLAGCAGVHGPVEKPEVTLADMQVVDIKPFEAVVRISLRVMNPNDFALPVDGVRCDLKIDGKHFATGIGNEHTEIPAYGMGLVPVTVYASTIKMFSSVLAMLQGMSNDQGAPEPIHYELNGTIRLGSGFGRSIPFQNKGELDLDLLQQTPKESGPKRYRRP